METDSTERRWDVSVKEALAIQRDLAGQITLEDDPRLAEVRIVAGVDCGYVKGEDGRFTAYAAAVSLTWPTGPVLATEIAELPVTFPYIPGFLSFREAPSMLAALARLLEPPDLLVVDGHGIVHPRRIGIAAHLGALLPMPVIGCAKSRLLGEYADPPDERGARTPIEMKGEVVGMALRTLPGHKPLLVSPGNRVSVEAAAALALAATPEERYLPAAQQAAHDAVTAYTAPLRKRGKR